MDENFLQAIKTRRSYYSISNEQVTSNQRICELVSEAVIWLPTAFNSQSSRVVILLGKNHEKLWDMVKDILQKIVPAEAFQATEKKIDNSFRSGYGSLLFYEDQSVVQGLQQSFPLYADNFPSWSDQASGMLQFAIWTALELDGWGASLQHYNPLIDDAVAANWNIPANWKLISQMPFGKPLAEPAAKDCQPLAERIRIYKD